MTTGYIFLCWIQWYFWKFSTTIINGLYTSKVNSVQYKNKKTAAWAIAFVSGFTRKRFLSDFRRKVFDIYFCLAQFTLFVYKSLIIVVENFQKYHWIQQETTQPVVVTRRRNKFLWTSEAKNRPFSIISSWIRSIYRHSN